MNPVLIFAFLMAGSLVWQNFGQEENWDLADQTEAQKAARLEELCQEDIPCLRTCTGSGAFGLSCTEHCGHQEFFKEICKSRPKSGQEEIRPSKPNNVQKSSENQLSWDDIWQEIWRFIVVFLMSLYFAPFGLLCWLLTLSARFSSMDGLALCIGSPRAFPVMEFEDQGYKIINGHVVFA